MFNYSILKKAVVFLNYLGGARHALFFAMPMLLIGALIYSREEQLRKHRKITYVGLFLVLLTLSLAETTILKFFIGTDITIDISIFGWSPAIPLLLIGLSTTSWIPEKYSRGLRKVSDIVYIIHIWINSLVRKLLVIERIGGFLITLVVSFAVSYLFILLMKQKGFKHTNRWS